MKTRIIGTIVVALVLIVLYTLTETNSTAPGVQTNSVPDAPISNSDNAFKNLKIN